MKPIIFLALCAPLLARPTTELVHDQDMPHLIVQWHRDHKQAPQPIRAAGVDPVEKLNKGDVLLWETYIGQPIMKGDLYVADYPALKMTGSIRECSKITATTITTLAGTTIPLGQVRGIVRRVIRVQEGAK